MTEKKPKRKKVAKACIFCKRSHMFCDPQRPCTRCIKREIGHLCRDEPSVDGPPEPQASTSSEKIDQTPSISPTQVNSNPQNFLSQATSALPSTSFLASMAPAPTPMSTFAANYSRPNPMLMNPPSGLGNLSMLSGPMDGMDNNEFSGLALSDFLKSIMDEPSLLEADDLLKADVSSLATDPLNQISLNPLNNSQNSNQDIQPPVVPANETEKFLLTAADQKDGSRDERLARVIRAKFEAGLLRPYNHVAGYARLMRWMETNMSSSSKQRVLQSLSEFRPVFKSIASALTELDLVFIEESFERLLLDYDRVFSTFAIPACLWRRSGEIFKGNKEFAELVGVPIDALRDGKLAIYELMGEESAVNYWEKYANIAFNASQKAVLTTCVLVNQTVLAAQTNTNRKTVPPEALINCCFSFTVRRDSYQIPSMIIGNFAAM